MTQRSTGRRTTVAMKSVMAVSGLFLVLFLLGHLFGNLKVFAGKESFNDYAEHLRVLGEPMLPHEGFIWIFRVVLLIAIIAHIASAVKLWRRAKQARSTKYAVNKRLKQTYAARTMRWGGIIMLMFIIFHLLHFTTMTIKTNPDGGPYDTPYDRLVTSFELWPVSIFYIIGIIMVGFHLRHGLWSAIQTLGLSNSSSEKAINAAATAVSIALTLGFVSIPLAVLFNIVN